MIEKRLITDRIGKINPLVIDDVLKLGGYDMFKKALTMDRLDIIDTLEKSMLRGRGGAGFPVAIKVMALAKEKTFPKYLICNADEGEPGNFKDRYLM